MASGASAVRASRAYVEIFADDSKLVRALNRARANLDKFVSDVRSVGQSLLVAGMAGAAPLAKSVAIFSQLDDSLRAVKAVAGATAKEFDLLSEKAMTLGRTTSFTSQQVAEAMLEIARAGFKTDQIDTMIEHVMNLSRATRTDIPRAAEIAMNAIRQFGMTASDTAHITDVLVTAANSSSMNLDELGESLKYVGPVARQLGLDIQDTAQMIALLANFGIKGSMSGTSLRNIMARLADPEIRSKIEALGVATETAAKKARPLVEIMAEIGQKIKGRGQLEQLGVMNELFGLRPLAGANVLATEGIEKLSEAFENLNGSAAKTAAEMDSGIGGMCRILVSALRGAAEAAGQGLAPTLIDLGKSLTKTLNRFAEWIRLNGDIVVAYAKGVASLIALGASMIAFAAAVHGASVMIKSFTMTLAAVQFIAKYSPWAAYIAHLTKLSKWMRILKVDSTLLRVSVVGTTIALKALSALTLIGIITAVGYLASKFLFATKEAVELKTQAKEAADALDEQINGASKSLDRLIELDKATYKTNSELAEMANIIQLLNRLYPELGLSLDVTTGKVNGLTDATKRFGEATKKLKILAIKDQITEEESNLETLETGKTKDEAALEKFYGKYYKYANDMSSGMAIIFTEKDWEKYKLAFAMRDEKTKNSIREKYISSGEMNEADFKEIDEKILITENSRKKFEAQREKVRSLGDLLQFYMDEGKFSPGQSEPVSAPISPEGKKEFGREIPIDKKDMSGDEFLGYLSGDTKGEQRRNEKGQFATTEDEINYVRGERDRIDKEIEGKIETAKKGRDQLSITPGGYTDKMDAFFRYLGGKEKTETFGASLINTYRPMIGDDTADALLKFGERLNKTESVSDRSRLIGEYSGLFQKATDALASYYRTESSGKFREASKKWDEVYGKKLREAGTSENLIAEKREEYLEPYRNEAKKASESIESILGYITGTIDMNRLEGLRQEVSVRTNERVADLKKKTADEVDAAKEKETDRNKSDRDKELEKVDYAEVEFRKKLLAAIKASKTAGEKSYNYVSIDGKETTISLDTFKDEDLTKIFMDSGDKAYFANLKNEINNKYDEIDRREKESKDREENEKKISEMVDGLNKRKEDFIRDTMRAMNVVAGNGANAFVLNLPDGSEVNIDLSDVQAAFDQAKDLIEKYYSGLAENVKKFGTEEAPDPTGYFDSLEEIQKINEEIKLNERLIAQFDESGKWKIARRFRKKNIELRKKREDIIRKNLDDEEKVFQEAYDKALSVFQYNIGDYEEKGKDPLSHLTPEQEKDIIGNVEKAKKDLENVRAKKAMLNGSYGDYGNEMDDIGVQQRRMDYIERPRSRVQSMSSKGSFSALDVPSLSRADWMKDVSQKQTGFLRNISDNTRELVDLSADREWI